MVEISGINVRNKMCLCCMLPLPTSFLGLVGFFSFKMRTAAILFTGLGVSYLHDNVPERFASVPSSSYSDIFMELSVLDPCARLFITCYQMRNRSLGKWLTMPGSYWKVMVKPGWNSSCFVCRPMCSLHLSCSHFGAPC